MSYELDSMQRLALWRLAVSDDGEFKKDLKFLSAARRKALIREGYIQETNRKDPKTGRDNGFLTLEDKGWSWCQEHMTDEISKRSTQPAPILEGLLKRLAIYFQSQNHTNSFGQFILQTSRANSEPGNTSLIPVAPQQCGTLEESIRRACLELGNGQSNVRVRLADLRPRIDAPRAELDRTLLEMEQQGDLTLYPLDNPQEMGHDDWDAALRTVTGNERHIVYLRGKA